jgi:predicted TIM-barrel fold metal-dependent hydrolase
LDLGIQIDHFGHPTNETLATATCAEEVPGLESMTNLLKGGNTWVKLSAAYRLQKDPDSPLVESLCKKFLSTRPDRCVFATDWPHTRFEHLDVSPYLEKVLDWCEEEGVSLEKVLVENAEELFDARG